MFGGHISKASDIYAYGIVLWEMLTGQQPYKGLHQVRVLEVTMRAPGLSTGPGRTLPEQSARDQVASAVWRCAMTGMLMGQLPCTRAWEDEGTC